MIEGLVSVISPVYNVEKFIEATIKSVLNQTYKNFEYILVDDCSLDNSAEIIQRFAQEYPKIKYYKLEKNSGVGFARNTGIKLAKGQYIAFLDSDDCWKPDKLEKEVVFAKRKKAEFVFTAIEMIDEQGNVVKGKRKVKAQIDYKFLLKNTMIATSSVLIDIDKVGKFEMPLDRSGEDYATWLMLLRSGRIAYHSDLRTNNSLGRCAVTIFLLMSGYLVGFLKAEKIDYRIKDSIEVWKNKARKFYWLYFLTYLVGMFLIFEGYLVNGNLDSVGGGGYLLAKSVLYLTFLQSWIPFDSWCMAINGLAWYMSVCMFCYFMQPLFEYIVYRLKTIRKKYF